MTAAANYPHISQRVVCVEDRPSPGYGWKSATLGRRYSIREVVSPHCPGGPLCVRIDEIVNPVQSLARCIACHGLIAEHEPAFRADVFRPLDEGEERTEAGYRRLLGAVDELPWLGRPREPAEEPKRIRERPGAFPKVVGWEPPGGVVFWSQPSNPDSWTPPPDVGSFRHGLTHSEALKFVQLYNAMKASYDRARKK